ncbi:MAG: chromosomal replication initiator protein DnaA [Candidatus Omnitrophica bacterium]|nr:chromosomal replication initiator protein DnaA [Candidatus Omnitrophota bacterium]
MDFVNNLWEQICRTIKPKIGDTAFEAWLRPIRAKSDEAKRVLVLEVPNDFSKDWVMQHYDLVLREALKTIDSGLGIDYRVNASLAPKDRPAERRVQAKEKTPDGFVLNPKYTFNNFVVGPSNRFTHAACMSIAESPAKAYNPLFIYGRAGLGKTHLMQAICHRIRERNPQTKFYYITSEKFTNELISAIQHRSTQAFRDKFRNVDVLLIDDIQFIANKEATQEEFFHTFNTLYEAHKQIIISSDRSPKEIQKLEERLVSRFAWGLVTDIQPPDLETRIAILKKKVENESIQIPDDVIFFIAEIIKTNVRELEGALVRTIAYSLLQEEKITLEMAKGVLKDLLKETSGQVSIENIQRIVADYFKIQVADLKTKKRIKSIVTPRQVAMYLARELTNLSLPEIGQCFGGKDHTTVLYAHKKIKVEASDNQKLKNILDKLLLDIKD